MESSTVYTRVTKNQKWLLITGGIMAGALGIMLILWLFPELRPHTDYFTRHFHNQSLEVHFRDSDGDLFVALPGAIQPPAEDTLLASFVLEWDENGFRKPAMQSENYPIAAFGDSYTEGFNVPVPWADRLAEILNVPVRNYGYRAYGPKEVQQVATEFAFAENRSWVLYAFFSGNDLGDATRDQVEYTPLAKIIEKFTPPASENKNYDYPMPTIIGGNYFELVYLNYYLWNHIAPDEGFEASENFTILEETLDTIHQLDPAETCLGFIFIPTKEELYYPYVYDTERRWLRENAAKNHLIDGKLALIPEYLSEEREPEILLHLTDLHDAVQKMVEDKPGWYFIDLLPAFQKAVANGELLYYSYDSHWNQDGHDLAAREIADFLRNTDHCE